MFPGGMNPKKMGKMMKRMGIKMDEIAAEEVIIRTLDKEIKIQNPEVVKTTMQGKEMFQISGDIVESEVEVKVSIDEEDVKMVAEQTGVSEGKAKEALEESDGDIAQAIMNLKG